MKKKTYLSYTLNLKNFNYYRDDLGKMIHSPDSDKKGRTDKSGGGRASKGNRENIGFENLKLEIAFSILSNVISPNQLMGDAK